MRILLHSPKDMVAGAAGVRGGQRHHRQCAVPAGRPSSVADVRLRSSCRAGSLRLPVRCRVRARSKPRRRPRARLPCRTKGRSSRRAADAADQSRSRRPIAAAASSVRHAGRRRHRMPASAPVRRDPVASSRRLAPRGGGAARAHRIWLWPVEADRHRSAPTPRPRSRNSSATRKLPVTGQMSDRLVRELTAMIGHPID